MSPSFTWTSTGTKTIYCTSFDPGGLSSSTSPETITVDAAAVAVYSQDFTSSLVFSESVNGPQTFSDTAEWVDSCGNGSSLAYTTGPYGQAMSIYKSLACGSASQLALDVPASAQSTETLTVSFWVYNPLGSSVTVNVQRAGGSPVSISIPGGAWVERTATVSSALSTSRLLLQFGLVPPSAGYVLKIDEIVVSRP